MNHDKEEPSDHGSDPAAYRAAQRRCASGGCPSQGLGEPLGQKDRPIEFIQLLEALIAYDKDHTPMGAEVQEIISRLTSGGTAPLNSEDPWLVQAKRLWDLGFGRASEVSDFGAYLRDIPPIPKTLLADSDDFPLLCLADPRLGLSRSCSLLGILFKELKLEDADVEPYDERHVTPMEPFWFRFTVPGKNMGRSSGDCRNEFIAQNQFPGTAMTGVMAFAHHPTLVEAGERALDLPGSKHHRSDRHACLWVCDGRLRLGLGRRDNDARPHRGAGAYVLA